MCIIYLHKGKLSLTFALLWKSFSAHMKILPQLFNSSGRKPKLINIIEIEG